MKNYSEFVTSDASHISTVVNERTTINNSLVHTVSHKVEVLEGITKKNLYTNSHFHEIYKSTH